ncbi:sulfurtransferase [Polynucleobacter sp. IMCC30063]|uniref:sulfurtransferase n=1 Tax=unclassified Polynucleobacter TaxID=2640945 RepID=UPI001F29D546|nr:MULTISPECIES: sulfurtransferase [unclassified Polynucleobacter]MCE7506327.1 sulfurtransferase [Polynucleobacter sp. IMCC30063]MCE7527607.1 sulfurtransferase [Polynucleobacter sp. IMCC 30228]MCE7529425.1 sulfurtransferase [Polynucleobacter sp. IMCC 29146]
MSPILNIASYQFVEIENPSELRQSALAECERLHLKGTILLAPEGINLFLAGTENAVRTFVAWLRNDPRFAQIEAKESWSDVQPFRRLLIKIKAEIIRMNHPTIQPKKGRAQFISPQQLCAWLDRGADDLGRPVVMLDTRNGFEVEYGTFINALNLQLEKFSDFPAAIQPHLADLQNKTVVSFCTGGIRCEKSGIYMRELGAQHSYQLEGGILKYFEEVGSNHYQGTCFVFDEREALEPNLATIGLEQSIRKQRIKIVK